MGMIWNKSKECMSRDEMSALQGKRLHKLVELVYHNVPFYREKMQERDLCPDDIQSIEDITKLPFTTKQDLRDNYPRISLKSSGFMPRRELRVIRPLSAIHAGIWRYGVRVRHVPLRLMV